jgi:cytoskeletal protein CcmA (bactofilin family)
MQSLISLLFIIAVASNPLSSSNLDYIGSLPGIDVTATRCADEDIAWSAMMPAVEVTAPRYVNEETGRASILPPVEVTAEKPARYSPATYERIIQINREKEPDLELNLQIADLKLFGVIPGATTFSGDYHLPEVDTIDEDVTITGGNARIDGVISGDLAVLGGTVDINGRVDGDVAVLGGNLDLMGAIDGDAAVFGGNIKNRGTIEGDLHVVGGTVYLDSASVIKGDISMVGGTVERDENAVVLGKVESVEIKALEKVLPRISRAFRFPRMIPGGEAFPRAMFLGMLAVLFVLNILVILIFPTATENIAEKIQQSVWASIGLGFALQILFVPLIVLLAVSIVGIPLIIFLPLAVFFATIFGITALALVVGERVVKGFNWKIESPAGKFSLGWLTIMIIPILATLIGPPLFAVGVFIHYIIMTIGVGSVIYTLIRRKRTVEVTVKK